MKTIILLMLFCLTTQSIRSEEISGDNKRLNEICLDIKASGGLKKVIEVKIPSHFVCLMSKADDTEKCYEFIPEGESANGWSEIITVIQVPSYGKGLMHFMKGLEDGYKSRGERCSHFINIENGVRTAFLSAEFAAGCPSPNGKMVKIQGKREFLTMKIVEEVNRFSIVQYSKRFSTFSPREERQAIIEQTVEYLKSCEIK